MEALPAELLQDVYQEALGAAVIGIDEGQFVSAWLGREDLLGSVGYRLLGTSCADQGLCAL